MLGAGHHPPERRAWWTTTSEEIHWTTLDENWRCNPNIVFDLNRIEMEPNSYRTHQIPYMDEEFHEIHAYEVIEHYGKMGNYEGFFRGFNELWRLLKPGGLLIGSTPLEHAVFSDPGHTRCVSFSMLSYLTEEWYENVKKPECRVTDYRHLIDPHWWELVDATPEKNTLGFAMRKV